MALIRRVLTALYASLQSHNAAIRALDNRSKRYQERIDKLEALLNDLEHGFNPNYVDMAVINTVKAWKGIKGHDDVESTEPVPSGTDTAEPAAEERAPGDEEDEGVVAEEELSEEETEDQKWSDWEIKQLTERMDYVNLLLEHERHVEQGTQGLGGDQAKSLRELDHLIESLANDRTLIVCASLSILHHRIHTGRLATNVRDGKELSSGHFGHYGPRTTEAWFIGRWAD